MSLNRVILMGNLTRDPEVRDAGVCVFGMAMNRKYRNREDKEVEEVTFVDIEMWGKRGEALARFHRKGDGILIEGRLRLDQWEDKESGQKRSKLLVVGENWEFLPRGASVSGGGRDGAPRGDGGSRGEDGDHFADQRGGPPPERRPAPASRPSYGNADRGSGGAPQDQYRPDDKDIPF